MASLDRNQQAIVDWLSAELKLPVFANAYEGAAQIILTKPPGYVSFVSHAGRDLMNALANTYLGEKAAKVDYFKLVGAVEICWSDEWGRSRQSLESVTNGQHEIDRPISVDACLQIQILVSEHRSGEKRNADTDIRFFTTFLNYKHRNFIPPDMFQKWKLARKWFAGHAHLGNRTFDPETDKELIKQFRVLEEALYAAATSTTQSLKELNEILDQANA